MRSAGGVVSIAFKVSFDEIQWQQIRPDVRQKVYCEGSRQIRLVEFEIRSF